MCRKIAFKLASELKIKNNFNKNKSMAGKRWFRNFMNRNKNLSVRKPEATSLNRINSCSSEQIEKMFQNLSLMSQHNYKTSRILNIDETGFTTVHRPQIIIAPKGVKQISSATSGERGKTTTAVCCVSASGSFIPSMFIFARKRWSKTLGLGAPEGSIIEVSTNGWINDVLFLKYLKHVVSILHPQLQARLPNENDILEPALLVIDNHESHCTLEVIDFCRIHNINIVTLPPHSSHKTQPLDKTFFGPLKRKYDEQCDDFMRPKKPEDTVKKIKLEDICGK